MPRRTQSPVIAANAAGLSVARSLREKYSKTDLGYGIHAGSDALLSDVNCWISTQAPSLDFAIGQPGIPTGKITTIFGREGSGKSLLGYHLLAEVQKMGGVAILADTEGRFTKDRALNIGIDLDELIIIEGLSLEKTWKALTGMLEDIRSANTDMPVCIVFDSVAEAVPQKRLDAEVGDHIPAQVAKFFGEELGKLKMNISRHRVAFVFVNQIRSRVDFGGPPGSKMMAERNKIMGAKHSMIAEWPLIFGSALMIRVNSISQMINGKDRDHPIGVRSRFVVSKSGISGHEGWKAELAINFAHGLDLVASTFDGLVAAGCITQSGAWYKLAGDIYTKSFHEDDWAEIYIENKEAIDGAAKLAPREWLDDSEALPVDDADAEFEAAPDRYGDDD